MKFRGGRGAHTAYVYGGPPPQRPGVQPQPRAPVPAAPSLRRLLTSVVSPAVRPVSLSPLQPTAWPTTLPRACESQGAASSKGQQAE